MPLATEVDLGPGHITLDGDPVPTPERSTAAATFGTRLSLLCRGLDFAP